MKLLIDTNVILDVLLKRGTFFQAAAEVLSLAQSGSVQGYVSASAITDIYYIARRQTQSKAYTRELLKKLLKVVSVATVTEETIRNALDMAWSDFEDSVQYSAALFSEMDGIVTRNPKDYREADISVWTPEEILQKYT